ncbi:hypothetical protein ANANG_G00267570, partial [Anguilla anguilla]
MQQTEDWEVPDHTRHTQRLHVIGSIHIVALGSERSGLGLLEEGAGQPQGGLLWSYLGRSVVPGVRDTLSRTDGSLLSSTAATLHPMNPAFIQYQARMFGDVRVLVHDCPSWDLLDRDWVATRGVLEQADILVIKYSVNDKLTFQQVRDAYSPRIRPLLRHWAVPVIVAAVGARLNEEGPPCTCPLCASDWSSSVPHNEGLQLARDLGATYLELPSLNDFFVGRYFGGVLEYFMVQCLKQKAKERPDKRRTHKASELRPPQLEQPARLPAVRVEESRFSQDMQWLLERGVQFADVAFYAGDSGKELGWAHAAVLCSVSPYFRQLLLGAGAGPPRVPLRLPGRPPEPPLHVGRGRRGPAPPRRAPRRTPLPAGGEGPPALPLPVGHAEVPLQRWADRLFQRTLFCSFVLTF